MRQILQDASLPFANVLTDQIVLQAIAEVHVCWLDRIYTPLVTLWVFLGQVLSADHSCRAAVARLIAHRLSQGKQACSAETGAYCLARKRLPETLFSEVARQTGRALDQAAKELDLRCLKQTLQMDILRCKIPELVRKEIWTHILA